MYFIFYILYLYLICISYFIPLFNINISFFIYWLYHWLFFILCLLFWVIRIGIILSLSLGLCLVVLGIYDNIRDISPYDDFYFYVLFWDHWLYVIDLYILRIFIFYVMLWVYNPCDMWIIYIIELGFIYSISFLFVFFGMSSFIILEV